MRAAIVEDEPLVARRLERMVRAIAGAAIEVVAVEPTLGRALELVRQTPIDLLFLDLNLNGCDGFRLLEEAAAGSFQTIVVSAHHDQALRAFELGVADFVAKPWSEERLRLAIERVLGRERAAGGRARCLAVRKGREVRTLAVERVVFIRGADDFSELHLDDGSLHLHQKTLAGLEAVLPPEFARIHRSYIVSLAHARGLRMAPGRRAVVVLADGRTLPVGRSYRSALRERLGA